MAFRIQDSVVRGEIDNRVKGLVRGRIWLAGRADPIVLELQGNAWPDLAGCLLTFTNRLKPVIHPRLASLNPLQRGWAGDMTASRKVRVFDVPEEQALAMIRRGEKPPEHAANALYLEWFSEANGRVVIESADYDLDISAPEWRMTPEENEQRAKQAAAGMEWFLRKLTEAIERHQRGQKDPDEEWDEHDYERFLKECDARTEKYGELLDKYGWSPEAQEKIAREMGWLRDLTEEEAAEEAQEIEEINRACEEALSEPLPEPEPHREGIDWIRTEDGTVAHPLQHRCFRSASEFRRRVKELGLDQGSDPNLGQFLFEFQVTAAKLAGALNPIARGECHPEPAFTVAYLKRALGHLHQAQAGLEAVAQKKQLPQNLITEARQELFQIREGILTLMESFRRARGS